MKLTKLICVAVAATTFLLTSCLESNDEMTYDGLPGVAYTLKGKTVVETGMGTIYSPAFNSTLLDGTCVAVAFSYKSSDPENANEVENGYSYVTSAYTTEINKGNTLLKTDTATLMTNEIALKAGVASLDYHYFALLKDHMFITSAFTGKDKQVNDWYLAIDPDQEAEEGQNGSVYTFFVRATMRSEGQNPTGDYLQMNAYNVQYQLAQIDRKENTAGGKQYFIKFAYINEIKEDGTFSWDETDEVGPFAVSLDK